jgi:hypothetical protein
MNQGIDGFFRRAGGYDVHVGFTGKSGRILVVAEHARRIQAADAADAADEQDELSEGVGRSNRQYKTIATHGAEVAIEAQKVAKAFVLHGTEARVLELAGLAHDIGKAHPAFSGAIRDRDGIAYAMADAGGIPAFNMRGRCRIKWEAQPRGGADKGERDGRA